MLFTRAFIEGRILSEGNAYLASCPAVPPPPRAEMCLLLTYSALHWSRSVKHIAHSQDSLEKAVE